MNKMNTLAFVNFFIRQTFPNPDSSKFSTVKNLRHTIVHTIKFTLQYQNLLRSLRKDLQGYHKNNTILLIPLSKNVKDTPLDTLKVVQYSEPLGL